MLSIKHTLITHCHILTNLQIGGNAAIEATGCTELISIPTLSPDGVYPITIPTGVVEFQDEVCGPNFGIEGATVAQSLVCELFVLILIIFVKMKMINFLAAQKPFVLGVQFSTNSPATASGFNMDYTQVSFFSIFR